MLQCVSTRSLPSPASQARRISEDFCVSSLYLLWCPLPYKIGCPKGPVKLVPCHTSKSGFSLGATLVRGLAQKADKLSRWHTHTRLSTPLHTSKKDVNACLALVSAVHCSEQARWARKCEMVCTHLGQMTRVCGPALQQPSLQHHALPWPVHRQDINCICSTDRKTHTVRGFFPCT